MSRQSYKPSSREKESPSFSSTLLDAIYRSIESENDEEFSQEKKKDQVINRSTARRNSMEYVHDNYGDQLKKESNSNSFMFLKNSSWSSSDSSFSGAEAELLQHVGKKQSSNTSSVHRPKPIRTTSTTTTLLSSCSSDHRTKGNDLQVKNRSGTGSNKLENKEAENFVKMKLRALKIYGDLKKVKQPISPGGKLASFVNSLFASGHNSNNGNNKKKKPSGQNYDEEDERRKSKSTNGSTCSSASSFSRSCLSSSSSSTTKDVKRSVRFCPVNVILDDDQHYCGAKEKPLYHQQLQQSDYSLKKSKKAADYNSVNNNKDGSLMIKNDIREMLKKYHHQKRSSGSDYMNNGIIISDDDENQEDEEEDEDAASCASSDLFELDSLAGCNNGLGLGRYTEELPVYETTYLDTSRLSSGCLMV